MPSISLTYFDIEAVAEKVRLALVMTGTDFEDKRIKFDEWTALKPTTPFGQLPLLQVDDKVWTQSYAMLRWAGKLGDGSLYADANMMEIEEVIGLHMDMANAWAPCLYVGMRPAMLGHEFADDDAKKAKVEAMRTAFLADGLPRFLGFYSKILSGTGAFFCGEKVTIADLAILPQLRYFRKGVADFVPATCLDEFPVVTAWMDRMMELPQIKAWYEKH
eukprot:TRINITY_DN1963_c0_g1_i4.p1 TRINITY_DN1963_c0_g1~~TRINITY_DN1963_c0_g1_i4.p1  ORF type:complete len:218 (+),score=43.98 TRINITY_DN1963_c0_g1_i4:68-721(+)